VTAAQRLARATLAVRAGGAAQELAVHIDQVLVQRQAGMPVEGDPVEIRLEGPLRELHTRRLPDEFTLVTIGQVIRRSGGVGRRRISAEERRRLQLSVQVSVDRFPTLQGQIARAVEPDADGFFRQETHILLHPGQPPSRYLDYTVDVRTRSRPEQVVATTRMRLELVTVQGFLELVDQAEKLRPAGQSPLEFVASVRRLYQNLDLFRWMIQRHKHVAPFGGSSQEVRDISGRFCAFEQAFHGSTLIDLGHVLVGIEVMPRQDPRPIVNVPRVDLALTWSGDLGSVIGNYVLTKYFPPPPVDRGPDPPHPGCTAAERRKQPDRSRTNWTLGQFISAFAGEADLLGDLDGVNIGADYDAALPLARNLLDYFDYRYSRRYSLFIANTKDDSGNVALPLQQGVTPPTFTVEAADFVAREIAKFAFASLVPQVLRASPTVQAVLAAGSPEVRQVTQYFLDFLQRGLAAELGPYSGTGVKITRPDGSVLTGAEVRFVRPNPRHSDVARISDAQGRAGVPEPDFGPWQVTAREWELLPAAAAGTAVAPVAVPAAVDKRALPDPGAHITIQPGTTVDVVARRALFLTCPMCAVTFRTVEPMPGGTRPACPHDGFDLASLHDTVTADRASFTAPLAGQNPAATPTTLRSRGTMPLATAHGQVSVYWDESRFLAPHDSDYVLWRDTPAGGATVHIVGRRTWNALPPMTPTRPWEFHQASLNASPAYRNISVPLSENRPLAGVFWWMTVHHTTDKGLGSAATPIAVQEKHQTQERNTDVGYHFIIDIDGTIYEGRPLGLEGQHTDKFNAGNIGIVLAGDFESRITLNRFFSPDEPTPSQLAALVDLVQVLAARFKIRSVWTHQERKLQSETGSTACPGTELIPFVRDVLRPAFPGPPE
jgi:hypothetical protein